MTQCEKDHTDSQPEILTLFLPFMYRTFHRLKHIRDHVTTVYYQQDEEDWKRFTAPRMPAKLRDPNELKTTKFSRKGKKMSAFLVLVSDINIGVYLTMQAKYQTNMQLQTLGLNLYNSHSSIEPCKCSFTYKWSPDTMSECTPVCAAALPNARAQCLHCLVAILALNSE